MSSIKTLYCSEDKHGSCAYAEIGKNQIVFKCYCNCKCHDPQTKLVFIGNSDKQ